MTIESGKVATGDDILAADYNKLRNDLLVNHDHSSGQGGTPDHKDLDETGDMAGMSHRHDDIEVHMAGGGPGPNAIDEYGGDRGAHGLAAAVKIAGALNYQWVVDAGTDSVGSQLTVGEVTFSTAFSTTPYVVATMVQDNRDPHDMGLRVYDCSTTGFKWFTQNCTVINWLAIGTVTT